MDILENVKYAKTQLKKIDIIFIKRMPKKEILYLIYPKKNFMKQQANLVIIVEN